MAGIIVMEARKRFVGGNWKCNFKVAEVEAHISSVLNAIEFDPEKTQVLVAPNLLHLAQVKASLKPSILVGAQNVGLRGLGAYTGEIAAVQLKDFGVDWVIIGHSERRNLFSETDEIVSKKVEQALGAGLNIILCIGENLSERENGLTFDVITKQLVAVKDAVNDWNKIVVAYEPVWAIGTGVNATPEQAQEAHVFIRNWLGQNVSEETSRLTRIIYGGSVTEANSKDLILQPDLDGFLVGGASLKPGFKLIVESTN